MTRTKAMARRLTAEAVGTGLLLASIVGSGIVVGGASADASVQLFIHAVVVGATLTVLIGVLGPISGAHFNPVVTLAFWLQRTMSAKNAVAYIGAQVTGGVVGTAITNAMFRLPAITVASKARAGGAMLASELVATTGLLLVIFLLIRAGRTSAIAASVGAYITAAIMFTPSDSFANPAVTVSRVLTDTWTGIMPSSVPLFVVGQLAAVFVAVALANWLIPTAHAPTGRIPEEIKQ